MFYKYMQYFSDCTVMNTNPVCVTHKGMDIQTFSSDPDIA